MTQPDPDLVQRKRAQRPPRDDQYGVLLSLLAHGLLILLMVFGFASAPDNPGPVQVELWARGTDTAVPTDLPEVNTSEPEPEPLSEPEPEPETEPAPEVDPEPEQVPEPEPEPEPDRSAELAAELAQQQALAQQAAAHAAQQALEHEAQVEKALAEARAAAQAREEAEIALAKERKAREEMERRLAEQAAREAEEKAAAERAAAEKAAAEKAAAEKAAAEKAAAEKAAAEKAAAEKAAKEKAAKEKAAKEAAARREALEALRSDALQAAGIPDGNANRNQRGGGGNDGYAAKIRACVQPGVIYNVPAQTGTQNPTSLFRVHLESNGQVRQVELIRSSGISRFDGAVQKGILACSPFPKPPGGKYPSYIDVDYRMYDQGGR